MKCTRCGVELARKYDFALFHCGTCKLWYELTEDGVIHDLRTRDVALELLKTGYSPSKIAKEMSITTSSVMQYLYYQIGEGHIRRSDMIFTIDLTVRDYVENLIATKTDNFSSSDMVKEINSSKTSIDADDATAYLDLRNDRLAFGDMYEYVREAELNLHTLVKKTLISRYGTEKWWRDGVPDTLRGELARQFETDSEPAAEPYCYTSIIQLGEIIKSQWALFQDVFPKRLTSDRKSFLEALARLNRIRRMVMHPSREKNPTTDDFAFVREFRRNLLA
jgi:predicted transcriptional regulator